MLVSSILAATTKTSSGSFVPLLVILVLFGGVYFLFLRPRTQAARKARLESGNVQIDDEVQTIGGIVGVVVAVSEDGEQITIATGQSPGAEPIANAPTRMTFVKRAVQKRPQAAAEAPSEPTATADGGEITYGIDPASEPTSDDEGEDGTKP